MLTSISPLGERARHNRWSITVSWYAAASVAAAAATGAFLGLLGGLAGRVGSPGRAASPGWVAAPDHLAIRAGLLAALAVVAAVADGAGVAVPGPRRQVDEDWLHRYRGWVYGAGFGAQLGAGVTTIVTTATVWLWLAAALLAGSWPLGAATGATFGLARAVPLLGAGRVRSFAGLQRRHATLVRWGPAAARVAVGATALIAAALAAIAARAGGLW